MHNCKFQVLTKCIARYVPKSRSSRPIQIYIPHIFNSNIDNVSHCLNLLPSACRYYGRRKAYSLGRIAVSKQIRSIHSQDHRCVFFSRRSDNDKLLAFKDRMISCTDDAQKYDYLMELKKESINLYYRYLCDNTAEVLTVINAVDSALDDFSNLGLNVTKSPNMQRLVHVTRSLDFDRTVNDIRQYINAENKRKAQTRVGFAMKKKQKEQNRERAREKEKEKDEKLVQANKPDNLKKSAMQTPKLKYVMYVRRISKRNAN